MTAAVQGHVTNLWCGNGGSSISCGDCNFRTYWKLHIMFITHLMINNYYWAKCQAGKFQGTWPRNKSNNTYVKNIRHPIEWDWHELFSSAQSLSPIKEAAVAPMPALFFFTPQKLKDVLAAAKMMAKLFYGGHLIILADFVTKTLPLLEHVKETFTGTESRCAGNGT